MSEILATNVRVKRDPERLIDSETNPCLKEQEMTYRCLSRNNYENSKCENYFDNYNECKKFWNKIRIERRSKGIIPNIPGYVEREKIRAEYFKSQKT